MNGSDVSVRTRLSAVLKMPSPGSLTPSPSVSGMVGASGGSRPIAFIFFR